MDKELLQTVSNSLNENYEHIPEIVTWTASDLAMDLIRNNEPCFWFNVEELIPYCETWLIQFAGRP